MRESGRSFKSGRSIKDPSVNWLEWIVNLKSKYFTIWKQNDFLMLRNNFEIKNFGFKLDLSQAQKLEVAFQKLFEA